MVLKRLYLRVMPNPAMIALNIEKLTIISKYKYITLRQRKNKTCVYFSFTILELSSMMTAQSFISFGSKERKINLILDLKPWIIISKRWEHPIIATLQYTASSYSTLGVSLAV